jgi:polar amino acid transport system permease protein
MTTANTDRGATSPPGAAPDSEPNESEPIRAIKLRHPWRTVFAVVVILAAAVFIVDAAMRPAFDWPSVGKYLFDRRITAAALVTLELTVLSMIIAIVLGVILAIMRLSPNPVLKSVAWLYVWLFRGTPV